MRATCFIVPASLTTTLSASASVVEVAEVSPSMMFTSAVVTVSPSNTSNSALYQHTYYDIITVAVA